MRNLLTLLLLAATSLANATDWNAVLRRQVEPHWPGGKVSVKIMETSTAVPKDAQLRLTGVNAPLGLTSFEWSWAEKQSPMRKFGTATVNVKMKVAVAKAPLSNGQPLDMALIEFVEHELSPLNQQGFFTKPQELSRRKIRGYVAPGAVLGARNTTAPMLVEQGQAVTLSQIKGALQLGAQMESLQNGALGEWIRVSHPKTHKVIRARIAGPGLVELN